MLLIHGTNQVETHYHMSIKWYEGYQITNLCHHYFNQPDHV